MTIGKFGIIIDGVKYIHLSVPSLLLKDTKGKSLFDTIYCILRDVFRNTDGLNIINQVNNFNQRLAKGINCDENPDTFDCPDALYDKEYMKNLLNWLDNFKEHYLCPFEKVTQEETSMIDMSRYIKFDEWLVQFEDMKRQVREQYEILEKWESVD